LASCSNSLEESLAASALSGVGLGPLAVLPELQRQGIGKLLIAESLQQLRRSGLDYIVLLGHPSYYPRLGFVPASRFGLRCAWPAPDEAFMALELRTGALQSVHGLVLFEPEFNDV
jgi:putative acetyltransferase